MDAGRPSEANEGLQGALERFEAAVEEVKMLSAGKNSAAGLARMPSDKSGAETNLNAGASTRQVRPVDALNLRRAVVRTGVAVLLVCLPVASPNKALKNVSSQPSRADLKFTHSALPPAPGHPASLQARPEGTWPPSGALNEGGAGSAYASVAPIDEAARILLLASVSGQELEQAINLQPPAYADVSGGVPTYSEHEAARPGLPEMRPAAAAAMAKAGGFESASAEPLSPLSVGPSGKNPAPAERKHQDHQPLPPSRALLAPHVANGDGKGPAPPPNLSPHNPGTRRVVTSLESQAPPRERVSLQPRPAMREQLAQRADKLLQLGDFAGARLLLEKAVEQGNAKAALVLAETYDSRVLVGRYHAPHVRGNDAKARQFYAVALAAGIPEAANRLALDK